MIVPGRLAGLSGIDTLEDDHRHRGTHSQSTVSAVVSALPRNHDWKQFRKRSLPLSTGIPTVRNLPDTCWRVVVASMTSPLRRTYPYVPKPHRDLTCRLLRNLATCEVVTGMENLATTIAHATAQLGDSPGSQQLESRR